MWKRGDFATDAGWKIDPNNSGIPSPTVLFVWMIVEPQNRLFRDDVIEQSVSASGGNTLHHLSKNIEAGKVGSDLVHAV